MGGCISYRQKSNNYTRNELLALQRDAYKYGINKDRYFEFCKSENYKLDVNAWNKWKSKQEWGLELDNITEDIFYKLVSIKHDIPEIHCSVHFNSLKKYYILRNWDEEIKHLEDMDDYSKLQDIDNFINYILDLYRYNDIVQHIKEIGDKKLWDFSQDSKWDKIVNSILKTSYLDDIIILEYICSKKKELLLSELDNKIII